jgi:hypothetical protein
MIFDGRTLDTTLTIQPRRPISCRIAAKVV